MTKLNNALSRRDLLRLASICTGALATHGLMRDTPHARADERLKLRSVEAQDRKLLFVLCAYGGASIIDSFLPVAESQLSDPFTAQTLNVFADSMLEQPAGSNLRVPRLLDDYSIYARPSFGLPDFVKRHGQDVLVIAHDVSSVNHTVGQQRSLNGAGIDRGRTLMEAMALRYGGGLPLPNINMASDGFVRHGADPSVPLTARHELISQPTLFGAGTHGYAGLGSPPNRALLDRARGVRARLDQESAFARTFKKDPRLASYLHTREQVTPQLEAADLLSKLLLLDARSADAKYGVKNHPITDAVRTVVPNIEKDPVEAQVALAFLTTYHGVSTSAVLGFPTDPVVTAQGAIEGTPIAFDFSHASHRVVQSTMWARTATMLDKLITLLKTHDYLGDPKLGKMWDRSLVYVATEFGRDKIRPFLAADWGTGHHLNNGSVLISPLLKGNTVYGGVDPNTCLTHGCDLQTGAPIKETQLDESHVYGLIAHALDLDAAAAPRLSAALRS